MSSSELIDLLVFVAQVSEERCYGKGLAGDFDDEDERGSADGSMNDLFVESLVPQGCVR